MIMSSPSRCVKDVVVNLTFRKQEEINNDKGSHKTTRYWAGKGNYH